jgi:hypothetical protein
MSTEPQPEPAGTRVADEGVQQQAARPSDQPDASIDVSPGDQRAAASWVRATDPSGALRATRDMPEPDSLGG